MVDTSVIGKPLAPSTIVIERGPASNFAKAVKDDSPIYQDPRAAKAAGFDNIPIPPTYGFAFANWGQFPELQPAPGHEPGHGGHRQPDEDRRPGPARRAGVHLPRAGRRRATRSRRPARSASVYEKTSSNGKVMTFITSENEYRNQRGELVLTARMTLLHRAS